MTTLPQVNEILDCEPRTAQMPAVVFVRVPQVENAEANLGRTIDVAGISKGVKFNELEGIGVAYTAKDSFQEGLDSQKEARVSNDLPSTEINTYGSTREKILKGRLFARTTMEREMRGELCG